MGDKAQPAVIGEPRGDKVLSDPQAQKYAFFPGARSSEMNCILAACAFGTDRSRIGMPITLDIAGCVRCETRQRPQDFDGAERPGRRGRSPCPAGRSGLKILHDRRQREILHRKHRLTGLALPARILLAQAAAEHHLHQVRAVDLGGAPRADQLAVAQHRDGVARFRTPRRAGG